MELPRGMKDFEAQELAKIEHIRENFLKNSNLFGFSFMEPSPLELLSVLETKSGPAIKDEIYYFTDKGDREIALRFDFTVGITRYAVSQKSMKLPSKISSFGGVWRYDEPQKGRYRYFHQWDLEIYGKPSIESESEIIELTSRLFSSLGLQNIVIDINHRKLVESFIQKTFQSQEKQLVGDILRAVDKIQKKSRKEILDEFTQKGYEAQSLEKILDFSIIKGTPEEIEKSFDVSGLDSWDDLKSLWSSLNNRGISNIRINFGIVRGLDYYSGTVFEVFDTHSKLGALAGGGRYDSLTKAFGRDDIGATGVAGGVERIILTMDEQGILEKQKQERVSVLFVNEEMLPHATNIASKLRQAGIPTDIDLLGRPLKKQMDNASESKYSIIVAPKEFAEKNIVLRNMQDGKEQTVNIEKLVSSPNSILNLKMP